MDNIPFSGRSLSNFHSTQKRSRIPESYPSENTKFGDAANNQEYLSFDKKSLNVGDKVYQIGMISDSYIPVLREMKIIAKLSDGQIHIKGSTIVKNTENYDEMTLHPSRVHSNPIGLVKSWLIDIRHKMDIELPQMKFELEKILSNIDKDSDIHLEVGEGLDKEMEI
jgi:hypothetical protein